MQSTSQKSEQYLSVLVYECKEIYLLVRTVSKENKPTNYGTTGEEKNGNFLRLLGILKIMSRKKYILS